MSTEPVPEPIAGRATSLPLRWIRLACWISAGFAVLPYLFWVALGVGEWVEWLIFLLSVLYLAGPYLAILWKLRKGPSEKEVRVAAGIAVGAFFITAAMVWLVYRDAPDWVGPLMILHNPRFRWIIVAGVTMLLVQALLFWNAQRLRRMLPESNGKVGLFGYGAVFAFYFLPVHLLVLPTYPVSHSRAMRNDISAQRQLMMLHEAAHAYQTAYENGFPSSLAVLGVSPQGKKPDCHQADLIDHLLAGGTKIGYTFAYSPGPTIAAPVADCPPGRQGFTVTARPVEYMVTGMRSFWMNESGVIHWTGENREATPNDPPVTQSQ